MKLLGHIKAIVRLQDEDHDCEPVIALLKQIYNLYILRLEIQQEFYNELVSAYS